MCYYLNIHFQGQRVNAYKAAASSPTPNQIDMTSEGAFYIAWERKWRNIISFKNLKGDSRHSHDCPLLTLRHSQTKEAFISATYIS